jgi:glycosyltransferase involved in cell wall biosynthesis
MSQRLDILFVGTLPPHPGGSAIANAHYLVGCAGLGHRIRALAPIATGAPGPRDFEDSHPGIAVTRYPVPSFEVTPSLDPTDALRRWEGDQVLKLLPELVARARPDVLLIGREAFLWAAPEVARAHALPCVLIIHGSRIVWALTGGWEEGSARRLREQLRKIDRLVTSAWHWAASLERAGSGAITVIPNAVDRRHFTPGPREGALLRDLGIREDAVVAVHPSNMKSLKRPFDIVDSAEKALAQDDRLVYVMVGDGPLRAEVEEACRERGLAERFRFTGWIDYPRMPSYIRLADLVLMPSEWEVQALVYLETLACGRLLVASDIPAAREVITDGETGLLFRMGDVDDLKEKTVLAAGSPALRAVIAGKAREAVRAHSLGTVAVQFAALLEEVVRAHRGKGASASRLLAGQDPELQARDI